MTINEEFHDVLVRHQTYLLRYSGYVRNRINALLKKTEGDIIDKLGGSFISMGGLNTPSDWKRLQRLQAQIEAIRLAAWDKTGSFLESELTQLAYTEPKFISDTLKKVLPVTISTVMPAPNMLKAIVNSQPFQGRILKDWARQMGANDVARIKNIIQTGMIEGQTTKQIVTRVIGTKQLNYSDGVAEITRREAQAVVRTAIMHIAGRARSEFLKQNEDVLEGEIFVATLDSRTTLECAANDGKIFPIGKGPMPPLHYNCRSLRVASINGEAIGERPEKPYVEKELISEFNDLNNLNATSRGDIPNGLKGKYDTFRKLKLKELIGQVPAKLNYEKWLRNQSNTFQDEFLGKTKAKLFRDGGLKLDKFVNRNGDELTLSQLYKLHSDAFKAAGL